jgi:GNAT superfamily N-acetyltransferase
MSDWESADGWEDAEGWENPSSVSKGNILSGTGEAALALGTNILMTPIAGLRGLGTLLTGGGLDKAVQNIEGVQQEAYQPRTQTGQKYAENAAWLLNLPAEYGGKLGEKVAGNEGRLVGEIAGEFATDLLPFGLAAKGLKGLKNKQATKPSIDATIASDAPPKPIAEPVQMELPLESSAQQIAEMQARATGQRDLFAPVNEPTAQTVSSVSPYDRPPPVETVSQYELFDQPELGRMANPYEAAVGDWRIDENGIPVKVDKSMELQNMENPLQRNLWGDELEATRPPVGQGLQGVETVDSQSGIPLTQAIDSMPDLPWRSARDEGIDMLKGSVDASGELRAAIMEANSRFPSGQRGAIDLQAFDDAFSKVKQLADGITLRIKGIEGYQSWVEAFTPDGKKVGEARFAPTEWVNPSAKSNADSTWTNVEPEYRGKGLAEQMYKFAAEHIGDIQPSKSQTMAGARMWTGFEKRGISQGMRIPRGQRGAIDFSFGDKRGKQLLDEENTQSRQMMKAADDLRINGAAGRMAEIARTFSTNIPIISKASRLYNELAIGLNNPNLNVGGTIQHLHDFTNRMLEAAEYLRQGDTGSFEVAAQNAQWHLQQAGDYQATLRKYLEEVVKERNAIKRRRSTDAKEMVKAIDEILDSNKAAIGVINSIGNRERGALIFGPNNPLPPEQKPARKDTTQEPRSAENIAKKQEIKAKLNALDIRDPRVREYDTVNTIEEAKSLAPDTKDIPKDYGQKKLAPGLNFMAAFHGNPILRFAQTVLRNAHTAADAFSRKYITADKTGLSPLWSRMSKEERIQVMEALQSADKHQKELTQELMQKLEFNDKQIQFANTFKEATDAMYTRGNAALMEMGFEPFQYRKGYFPGIFNGAYKTLVTDANGKPVGVISVDTIYQQRAAKKYVEQNIPGAKLIDQGRRGLEGSHVSADLFSGMGDVFKLLGENDPKFAEVQKVVSEAIKNANHQLYNFNVHELTKKGVFGNEGNKPWLNPARNAEDAFKALVKYFEDGALYFELQQPLKDLKELASSPEVAHLPNTVKYMQEYVNNIEGKNVSDLGKALNLAIDIPAKLIGVGPGTTLKMTGAVKNRMSQIFMGFGNWMFTAAQVAQPIQTGIPFMSLVANKLGGDVSASAAAGKASTNFLLLGMESLTGQKLDIVDPVMREAFQYANDRGLLDFSEMEKAYEGTKSKAGRIVDTLAEANMKIGEQASRTPMFLTFVDMLVQGGVPVKKAMPIAENLTQLSMIDYHKWERPMLYSNLGVLGQFAGGLTTFKHGYTGQQALLAKQALKPVDGKRQIKPIAYSVMAMIAFAGLTGVPFYQELDEVYGYLSDKFGGERKTIRESFLENLPEWAKTGAVSTVTGLNMQGKFSSADMIPDSLAKAASPHLTAAADIINQAIDVAKYGDDQSLRNLLIASTPSGWKGWSEYEFARNDLGQVVGKDGMPLVNRTEEDWAKRKYTGLRPQEEAVARDELFQARKKEKADQEAKAKIANDLKRAVINNTLTQEKLNEFVEKYRLRKGDPEELVEIIEKSALNKNLTEKQRAEGIPSNSLSSVYRYRYYNK